MNTPAFLKNKQLLLRQLLFAWVTLLLWVILFTIVAVILDPFISSKDRVVILTLIIMTPIVGVVNVWAYKWNYYWDLDSISLSSSRGSNSIMGLEKIFAKKSANSILLLLFSPFLVLIDLLRIVVNGLFRDERPPLLMGIVKPERQHVEFGVGTKGSPFNPTTRYIIRMAVLKVCSEEEMKSNLGAVYVVEIENIEGVLKFTFSAPNKEQSVFSERLYCELFDYEDLGPISKERVLRAVSKLSSELVNKLLTSNVDEQQGQVRNPRF